MIVVGAGAAGIAAAAYLKRQGFSVIVLEAAADVRKFGRVRKGDPFGLSSGIDLGAEWIHVGTKTTPRRGGGFAGPNELLRALLRDLSDDVDKDFSGKVIDDCDDTGTGDHRWVDYTWWDFFNDSIVRPNNLDIRRGMVVNKIWGKRGKQWVYGDDGSEFQGTYVLVTVSMQLLQDETIDFTPKWLPNKATRAIDRYTMGGGIKAWLEFDSNICANLRNDACEDGKFSLWVLQEPGIGQGDGEMFFSEMTGHPDEDRNIIGYFIQVSKGITNAHTDAFAENCHDERLAYETAHSRAGQQGSGQTSAHPQ